MRWWIKTTPLAVMLARRSIHLRFKGDSLRRPLHEEEERLQYTSFVPSDSYLVSFRRGCERREGSFAHLPCSLKTPESRCPLESASNLIEDSDFLPDEGALGVYLLAVSRGVRGCSDHRGLRHEPILVRAVCDFGRRGL